MKKFLIAIVLIATALSAHAQFVVSLHLNGNLPKMAVTNNYTVTTTNLYYTEDYSTTPTSYIFDHATVTTEQDQLEHKTDPLIALGGGLKIGYQIRRFQFGLWGSFNWVYTHNDLTPKQFLTLHPHVNIHQLTAQAANPDSAILEGWQGWFKEYYTAFTIAPYMRVELIQMGDLAFFAEINAFYTQVNKPKRHEFIDFTYKEMHSTIDTSYAINHSTMSYGAILTPGLSWQLNPNCLLDLYLDFLALSYRYTKDETVTVIDEYNRDKEPWVLDKRTTDTKIIETTDLGFDLAGAPTLHNRIGNTWVRVGLSFTF